MDVFTYASSDPDCPAGDRALARIRCAMEGKGGKATLGWHPVLITAATEAEARAVAERWWAEQVAKASGAKRRGRPPKAKPMEAALGNNPAPPPPVVDEDEEAV